ncbi:MAG: ATP-binding cassette domain-containing protein, partial [Acidimicrobiales bacterium]
MTAPAAEIVGLHKRYGDGTEALRGIDLRVPAGGVFALLGRNGSGKTTAVRIMVGLTSSTSGAVSVLGHDVASERERVQARIGVTLQEAALDEVLTGREFLRFVARVQGRGRADAAARAGELLELFGL